MDLITVTRKINAHMEITKDFYAALCDSGAFNKEERWTRNILKAMCEEGIPQRMANLSPSDRQIKTMVQDIMHKMCNQYGYQADMVADVTHKLAIGLNLVDTSFDWQRAFGHGPQNKTYAISANTTTHYPAVTNSNSFRNDNTSRIGVPAKPCSPKPSGEPVITFHNKANGISFKMIKVEGGSFYMGLTPKMARKLINKGIDWKTKYPLVTVNSYYIGETVVTQALWKAVMSKTAVTQPGWKPLMGDLNNPSKFKGDELPVENVSWRNCQEFIAKLRKATRLDFRLPTEAEWEFAAKGGRLSKGYEFSGSNNLKDIAWIVEHLDYDWQSQVFTKPVKQKLPNELGLYDMNGNVWEWCHDWYEELPNGTLINPKGPETGQLKVLRGFSVLSNDDYGDLTENPCYRHYTTPYMRNPSLSDEGYKWNNYYDAYGFRLVLSL